MRLLTELKKIQIDQIDIPETRKLWRPESRCSTESLAPLIEQIRAVGWVDAVIVRPSGADRYELLDGERRLKAERGAGQTSIDAVIVHADERVAAAITLLCTLPPAELPAIYFARLVEWVRNFDREKGGDGTNAAVANYLRCDASTVSRLQAINDGLSAQALADCGLADEDLVELGVTRLHWLAKLEPSAKREALRRLREAREGGDSLAACARQLVATMRPKPRRGRRPKPFRVTDRSDGRFSFSIRKRPLTGEHARELLERLAPILREATKGAGIASLDAFLGLSPVGRRSLRAERTKKRISLMIRNLRMATAAKWRAISVAIHHLKDAAPTLQWIVRLDRRRRRSPANGRAHAVTRTGDSSRNAHCASARRTRTQSRRRPPTAASDPVRGSATFRG